MSVDRDSQEVHQAIRFWDQGLNRILLGGTPEAHFPGFPTVVHPGFLQVAQFPGSPKAVHPGFLQEDLGGHQIGSDLGCHQVVRQLFYPSYRLVQTRNLTVLVLV